MGDTFNANSYQSTFIADLVGFVAADEFQSMFESFFINFAMEFTDEDEHHLRYTEIYTEFQQMFEEQLLIFCHQKNVTQEDFYSRLRDISTEDEKTKHYVEILLSSCEYDTFVRLMRIMRPVAQMRMEQRSDAKGLPKSRNDTRDEDEGKGVEGGAKAAAKGGDDEDDGFGSGPAAAKGDMDGDFDAPRGGGSKGDGDDDDWDAGAKTSGSPMSGSKGF